MEHWNVEILMDCIMSYVGDYQYYFIASVNRSFYKSYTNVFPTRLTCYNVSTIQHAKICYDETASTTDRCKLCALSAKDGNLLVLQYLHELGCSWDTNTCAKAAKFGHLHILKWARYHDCDWNDWTCINAAYSGHLHILQWAYMNGFANNMSTWVSSHAAEQGQLAILKWLHFVGCPFHELCSQNAVRNGHVEVVQWLCAKGY
jgi:hypothetical protein